MYKTSTELRSEHINEVCVLYGYPSARPGCKQHPSKGGNIERTQKERNLDRSLDPLYKNNESQQPSPSPMPLCYRAVCMRLYLTSEAPLRGVRPLSAQFAGGGR
jgi:hypothetical protein